MSSISRKTDELASLFDEPVPFDRLVMEVLDILDITQQQLAGPAGLSQTVISNIIRRKTALPPVATVKKIRQALIEEFGVSAERATMDYFLESRALLEPRPAETVDSRFAEIDKWLRSQPATVQDNFWDMLGAVIRTVDSARDSS